MCVCVCVMKTTLIKISRIDHPENNYNCYYTNKDLRWVLSGDSGNNCCQTETYIMRHGLFLFFFVFKTQLLYLSLLFLPPFSFSSYSFPIPPRGPAAAAPLRSSVSLRLKTGYISKLAQLNIHRLIRFKKEINSLVLVVFMDGSNCKLTAIWSKMKNAFTFFILFE